MRTRLTQPRTRMWVRRLSANSFLLATRLKSSLRCHWLKGAQGDLNRTSSMLNFKPEERKTESPRKGTE